MFLRFDRENPNRAMTMGGRLLAGICVLLLLVSVALVALAIFSLGGFIPLILALVRVGAVWAALLGTVGVRDLRRRGGELEAHGLEVLGVPGA